MFFEDWEDNTIFPNAEIPKYLLWEYKLDNFDWHKMRHQVVQRVIELGRPEDFYAAIRLYGGLDNFIEIIKELPYLSDKDITLVSAMFHIKKQHLKSYRNKRVRKKLLGSK